jgi:cytochrome c oxidase subunit 2
VEGTYRILCAELCGLNHAVMVANVRVVSDQEFTAWMGERSGVAALSGD